MIGWAADAGSCGSVTDAPEMRHGRPRPKRGMGGGGVRGEEGRETRPDQLMESLLSCATTLSPCNRQLYSEGEP